MYEHTSDMCCTLRTVRLTVIKFEMKVGFKNYYQ
jgi:hypothetical protein